MSSSPPLRVWIHSRQPLLGQLLAESLASRGYAPQLQAELAAAPDAGDPTEPAVWLLEESEATLAWLRTQPPERARKCLILGEGDPAPYAALGCRSVALAAGVDAIAQALQPLLPGETPAHRLLIVDDDPDTRGTIREYFQALGYICSSASNGHEALEKIRADNPHVVLLDLNMPEMGGLEFLAMVRRLRPAFGIIVITAMLDPKIAAKAVSAGAFDVVEKPVNFQHLAYLVRVQISRRETRARG